MARNAGIIRSNARSNAVWGRSGGKIAALAAAFVAMIAFAAPGAAGASSGSGKACSISGSSAVVAGYNSSMAVDLSGTGSGSVDAVSWSDVSWSDSF